MRAKIVSIFTSICLMITLGCSPVVEPTKQQSQTKIHLAIDMWPGYYPAIIAKQRNIFKKHGLDVVIDIPNNTDRMLANFAAGKYQFTAVALGDVINLTQQYQGAKIIFAADESAGGDAILSYSSISSLAGSRIGTNLGGFGEVLVREMLKRQQVKFSDVELVNIEASQVPQLLAQNKLAFAHTWQPYVNQAMQQGANVVFSSKQTPGLIPDVVVVRADFAQSQPQKVKAFVKAWFEAQTWWLNNLAQGNQIIAAATQQEVSQISLNGIKLLSNANNQLLFDLQQASSLHKVVDRYSQFYVTQGILKQPVNATQLLDATFLP